MMHPTRRSFLRAACMALAAVLSLPLTADAKPREPLRLLLVTHTAGFRHSSIPVSIKTIEQLGRQNGGWTVDQAANADDVRRKITGNYLKNIDVVVFANTTGELPVTDEGKRAFMNWLRAGRGFVGMHAATDTFYQWADFGTMIGGYFDGHPWHEEVSVRVEEPSFPGVRSFGPAGAITDEIYQFRNWTRDDKRVILGIDNSTIDVTKGKREDRDYAIAWAKSEGKGRVFYTSLGHRDEVWADPRFQEHIVGGIRWAAGRDTTLVCLPQPAAKGQNAARR
jgi:uncharacterized protein